MEHAPHAHAVHDAQNVQDGAGHVEYAYCVIPSDPPLPPRMALPAGIDDARVEAVSSGALTALVSSLDASVYGPTEIAERTADRAWLAPRASAHHAVITWASDRGPVVPLPMWVMFSDRHAVADMLTARAAEMERAIATVRGTREYTVRVSLDAARLEPVVATLDPALADLEQQAAAATPGQAYLLSRKLAAARKDAMRSIAGRVAAETRDGLAHESRASAQIAAGEEQGVLRWDAYLVEDAHYDAFRESLTSLVTRYEPSGFSFDFTGPWPPFHFVRGD